VYGKQGQRQCLNRSKYHQLGINTLVGIYNLHTIPSLKLASYLVIIIVVIILVVIVVIIIIHFTYTMLKNMVVDIDNIKWILWLTGLATYCVESAFYNRLLKEG
jgi:hypothetical protein